MSEFGNGPIDEQNRRRIINDIVGMIQKHKEIGISLKSNAKDVKEAQAGVAKHMDSEHIRVRSAAERAFRAISARYEKGFRRTMGVSNLGVSRISEAETISRGNVSVANQKRFKTQRVVVHSAKRGRR